MPHLTTDDGIKLYYEETGKGIPIVFIHEFAGDIRSYEQQVRHFSKYYRCITFNARGYPPSDVPTDGERYSQDRARDDIRSVLDALKIEKAHIVGLSMGGFAALHFGFAYPEHCRSIVVAGGSLRAWPHTRAAPEQRSAGMAGICRSACRTFDGRRRAYNARRTEAPSVAV
jgi:pimeloyl-ACP methyl ester carboxylesterase